LRCDRPGFHNEGNLSFVISSSRIFRNLVFVNIVAYVNVYSFNGLNMQSIHVPKHTVITIHDYKLKLIN